jgi:hypothetical protein
LIYIAQILLKRCTFSVHLCENLYLVAPITRSRCRFVNVSGVNYKKGRHCVASSGALFMLYFMEICLEIIMLNTRMC